jgi:hypothetical protein
MLERILGVNLEVNTERRAEKGIKATDRESLFQG